MVIKEFLDLCAKQEVVLPTVSCMSVSVLGSFSVTQSSKPWGNPLTPLPLFSFFQQHVRLLDHIT